MAHHDESIPAGKGFCRFWSGIVAIAAAAFHLVEILFPLRPVFLYPRGKRHNRLPSCLSPNAPPRVSQLSKRADLPSKAGHHGVVDAIQLIADFRNAVRDIGEQSIVEMAVEFACFIGAAVSIFSRCARSSTGLAASRLATLPACAGVYVKFSGRGLNFFAFSFFGGAGLLKKPRPVFITQPVFALPFFQPGRNYKAEWPRQPGSCHTPLATFTSVSIPITSAVRKVVDLGRPMIGPVSASTSSMVSPIFIDQAEMGHDAIYTDAGWR